MEKEHVENKPAEQNRVKGEERSSARRSSKKKPASGSRRSAGSKKSSRSSGSSRTQSRPIGTDRQEIEWQYDAPEGLEGVEEWLGGCNGDSEGAAEFGILVAWDSVKELTDTYYDTEDWKLYRAGYALRVRRRVAGRGSEATMKSLASAGGVGSNLRQRREISEPLKGKGADALGKAAGPVGERLKALVGNRKLRPIFEIRTRRRVFGLLDRWATGVDGSPGDQASDDGSSGEIVQDASGNIRRSRDGSRIGEIALDSSEIPLGDGEEVVHLTRVEVEVDTSAAVSPNLEKFVKAMEGALALRPTTISKYEAGLFATGQSPEVSPDLGPDSVDDSLSAGEVAFAVLRRQFAVMLAHEPGTRLGEDPEELHDMRVATRRMRAVIKLFEDALPERARWFRDELKWVAGALGDVRDLDVQIEQLEELATEIGKEDRGTFSRIVTTLEKRRVEARERLLEALNSDRYQRFETSFADMLRSGPAESEPILVAAPGLLSRPYRKWYKAAKRIYGSSYPEEYHNLRKKGKRLRYALEFLSDVYGEKTIDGLVKPLKALQDDLGRHQDVIVASDLLEELATAGQRLPKRTVFVMGILAGRYRQEAAEIRASLPVSKAYRKLIRNKAWKDFEKIMKKRRSGTKAASKV